jgi:hypothetical protein
MQPTVNRQELTEQLAHTVDQIQEALAGRHAH